MLTKKSKANLPDYSQIYSMMKPTKPSAQICAWINNLYGVHYVCIKCIFNEFGRYDLFPILSF